MVKKQEYKRYDGRNHGQLRNMESEQSLLNKADGSAKFSQNKSSVLAAVYGPIEVNSSRKEKILKSYVEVTFTPALGNTSYLDKEKELLVKNAVESVILTTLHPRTQVSVIIQVYSDDGSIISCSINAACLALLDAGIEMNGLISSVTLSLNKINNSNNNIEDNQDKMIISNNNNDDDDDDDIILVDPDLKEENESRAVAIFAISSNSNNIVMSKTIGSLTEDEYFNALNVAKEGCNKITAYIKLAVKNRIMGTN